MDSKELDKALIDHLRQLGAKGGKARAKKMTKEQRVAMGKKMAKARWKNSGKKKS
jgi:hypothetical protein